MLELAVPVWHSSISLEQQGQIERVQKSSLAAILGQSYISYENALKVTNLKRLSDRREDICLRFIKKNMESKNPFLKKIQKNYNTRSDINLVEEIQCRTHAFFMSSIPFLARKFNEYQKSKFSVFDTP